MDFWAGSEVSADPSFSKWAEWQATEPYWIDEALKSVFQPLANESLSNRRESDYGVQTCGENPEGMKGCWEESRDERDMGETVK